MLLIQLMLMLNSYPKIEYFPQNNTEYVFYENCDCSEYILEDDPLDKDLYGELSFDFYDE